MAPQLVCIFIDAVARTAHFMKCIVRCTRIILKRSVLFFLYFSAINLSFGGYTYLQMYTTQVMHHF